MALEAEPSHGPVRFVGPGKERIQDRSRRIHALVVELDVGEETRSWETAPIEPPGPQSYDHFDRMVIRKARERKRIKREGRLNDTKKKSLPEVTAYLLLYFFSCLFWGRFGPGVEISWLPEAREVMQEGVEVVPVCSVGLTVWSRIWGKCNLGQATVSVKPFSYRKFLFGVFSFSETSFSSYSLTALRGHFLFHDHHGHQDSIFPEVIWS
ncbi:hypothetical protein KFK09_024143 [Dendrobium nobile]|uniref:Uncharacterized protein n=1 Tax=Dendrobium nobile TaxID=94219 RepID=A0A8T3AE20_DENNO|nr:hypothetical protein KFK09_024143 [Dendrobium nobile]